MIIIQFIVIFGPNTKTRHLPCDVQPSDVLSAKTFIDYSRNQSAD